MTREEKELIVKVIASATDKVPTKTFAELTKYFFEEKSCSSCEYWNSFNGVCFNSDSPLCADFVDCDFYCKYYERKEDETVS